MQTQHDIEQLAVRRQVDRIVEAIGAKDLDSLRALYATDVVSFDVEPPLQHVGVDAKLANWTKVFTVFREVAYEVQDLAVAVGESLAYGHFFGRLSGTLQSGETTPGMWVRGTLCLRKVDGTWLIAHDQASVPFDVLTGRGVTDLQPV